MKRCFRGGVFIKKSLAGRKIRVNYPIPSRPPPNSILKIRIRTQHVSCRIWGIYRCSGGGVCLGYNQPMSLTVAVDIGGTHIRAAVYEPNNLTPIAHKRTRTKASETGVFDRLVQTIESVWP